jgi:hypothetical protein
MGKRVPFGLTKEEIRRVVLGKLKVVYHDWHARETPFLERDVKPGHRREDQRAFAVALVAALLGGLSEAIERNNQAIAAVLQRRRRPATPRSSRRKK